MRGVRGVHAPLNPPLAAGCGVTLCSDCESAARDPHGIGVTWRDRLCCLGRSLAFAPHELQREAAAALTGGLSAEDADAVRARARQIIRERRQGAA